MFRCEECKEIFEEYKEMQEDTGEICAVCPYCNSEDIEEVNECECGEYKKTDEILCEKCQIDILKKFRIFMDTFTEEERKFINEVYDGEEL